MRPTPNPPGLLQTPDPPKKVHREMVLGGHLDPAILCCQDVALVRNLHALQTRPVWHDITFSQLAYELVQCDACLHKIFAVSRFATELRDDVVAKLDHGASFGRLEVAVASSVQGLLER